MRVIYAIDPADNVFPIRRTICDMKSSIFTHGTSNLGDWIDYSVRVICDFASEKIRQEYPESYRGIVYAVNGVYVLKQKTGKKFTFSGHVGTCAIESPRGLYMHLPASIHVDLDLKHG